MSTSAESAVPDPATAAPAEPATPEVSAAAAPAAAAAPGWDWRWTFPLVLAALVVIAFWPSFSADWVNWDDDRNFTQHKAWRGLGLEQLGWMWTTFHMAHWHPLTWMTLGLDFELYGIEDPGGFHVTNVVLHTAAALAAYFAARRMFQLVWREAGELQVHLAAFFGAALFAIHPLRVESVTWITERRDVLSGLFFFLCLGAWLRYVGAEDGPARRRAWIWSIVLFVCAGMSKVAVFPLPVVLLLLDIWPLKRLGSEGFGKLVREKLPHFGLMVCLMAIGIYGQRTQGAMYSFEEHPLAPRIVHVGLSHYFYLRKTFLPLNLSPMYEMPPDAELMALPWLGWSLIGAGATLLLFFLYRLLPAATFAIAWFTIMALPISGLSQAGGQFAADRYSYLPCIAFAFVIGAAPFLFARRGPWLAVASSALGLVLVVLGCLTWTQTHVWKDSKALWTHVSQIQEGNTYAMNSLGQLKVIDSRLEQDPEKKKELVREAIALHDQAYRLRGDPNHLLNVAGAIRDMADAEPEQFDLHLDNAIGTMEEAFKEAAKRGTEIRPHWYRLQGMLYVDKGRYEEGVVALERWLEGESWDADASCVLAQAYIELKRWEDAAKLLERVIREEPKFHRAWASMADLQGRVGQLEVARNCWLEVIKIAQELNSPDDDYAKIARDMLPQIDAALRRRAERQQGQPTPPKPPENPPR